MKKNNKGITLVSLVLTVIIMLILAAVSLNMILGNNGLFKKTTQAVYDSKVAEYKEMMKTEVAGKDVETKGETVDDDILEAVKKVSNVDTVQIGDATVTVDGKYIVDISDLWRNKSATPVHNVVKIGSTKYESLKAAVDAVPEDGTKTIISALEDFTVDEAPWVDDTKSVVLDCAGYTISGSNNDDIIQNGGLLEVKNGILASNSGNAIANCESTSTVIVDSTAKIQGNSNSSAAISNQGILKVLGGQVISNNNAIYNKDSGKTTCDNGALIKSNSDGASAVYAVKGTCDFNDCTIQNDNYTALSIAADGVVNLNTNSKIITNSSGTEAMYSSIYNLGNLNLNGGSITNVGTCITNLGTLNTTSSSSVTSSAEDTETAIYNKGTATLSAINVKNNGTGTAFLNEKNAIATISNNATFECNYDGTVVYVDGVLTLQGGIFKNDNLEGSTSMFNVAESGTLNILNQINVPITTQEELIFTEGIVNIKNATLENSNTKDGGCCILGMYNPTINLSNGAVIKSSSSKTICVEGGTLNVADATVENTADNVAVEVEYNGEFDQRGKLVVNNSASKILNNSSTETIYSEGIIEASNGVIKNSGSGSVLNAGNGSTTTISGNALFENNNSDWAGTIFIDKGTVILNSGTIRNSAATGDATLAIDVSSSGGTFTKNGGTVVGRDKSK